MGSTFFALLFRQKYIKRWGLMRNTIEENLVEHSAETAFIAHALAVIGNKYYGKKYNEERIALLALYHDAAEIITGDLPTPVKYYSEEMRKSYKQIEASAEKMLLEKLPKDFHGIYGDILSGASAEEKRIHFCFSPHLSPRLLSFFTLILQCFFRCCETIFLPSDAFPRSC